MGALNIVVSEGSTAAKHAVSAYFEPLYTSIPEQWRRLERAFSQVGAAASSKFKADTLIRERMEEIRTLAIEESIEISSSSEADLMNFLRAVTAKQRPKLFLLENGNIRAVWKGSEEEQIGLQFLGKGQVQYVIFSNRRNPSGVVQSYGRDTVRGILEQIRALDLSRVMFA